MATQQRLALLIDLYPPYDSPVNPASPAIAIVDNHIQLVKNKIKDILANEQASFTKLYLLTAAGHNTSLDLSQIVRSDESVEAVLVKADGRIAAFYEAKQKLDDLEIRGIKLVCDDSCKGFWNEVCQLLFTPVHSWSVDSFAEPSAEREESYSQNLPTDGSQKVLANISRGCIQQSASNLPEQALNRPQNTSPRANQGFGPQSATSEALERPSDSTKAQVQQFLRTLPSLLGLPEVDRSSTLCGLGAGFVHGYSTRRGGVTSVSTLCAMNMVYTDLKPDSPLVIEENRRRLALVGGFDHQNFHITRVEHGHRVWVVGEEQPRKFDALVTNRPNVTIAAAGADCIPLLFADPVAMVIGAAHAGWKGTVERVAECVVNTMKEKFGCRPEDIRVAMGPGVRPGCFVVPVEDQGLFTVIHPSCVVDSPDTASHRIHTVLQHSVRLDRGEGERSTVPSSSAEGDPKCKTSNRSTAEESNTEEGGKGLSVDDTQSPLSSPAVLESTFNSGVDIDKKKGSNVTYYSPEKSQVDFEVKRIPTEQLKPKTPRSPKDPKRQWVFVDLQLTNYHVLLQAGVKAEHIDVSTSHCTRCNTDLYFSNERDGFPFGNQIGFLYMPTVQ